MSRSRPFFAQTLQWRLGTLAVCALLIVGLVAFSVRAGPRSFAVQVMTRGLEIAFNGSAMNAWRLEGVTICFRNSARVSGTASPPADPSGCDTRLFSIARYPSLEMIWGDGDHVQIARIGADAPLEIQVLQTGPTPVLIGEAVLTTNSRILVDAAAWGQGSTLTMAGQVTLGRAPGPGSHFNVISGSYAVSETLPWTTRPVVVTSGELLSGDQAGMVVTGSDTPVNTFGFIEPRDTGVPGFGATIYSPAGEAELAIDRFGAVDIRVSPSWIDRWTANPILIAITAVVGFLAGFSGLISLARWVWHDADPAPTEAEVQAAGASETKPPTRRAKAPASRPSRASRRPAS